MTVIVELFSAASVSQVVMVGRSGETRIIGPPLYTGTGGVAT